MLEGLLKGLALWIYGLMLSSVEFIANALLNVFQMDMTYFETAVPVSKDIFAIIVGVGWALLIGNLTFQAMKTMASGIGFEGEDPKILFCRTFVFGFLLLASRQICEIGMSISNSVIDLLQVPASVIIPSIDENSLSFDGSWLLVIIIGIVMMFQIVKFFFQMGERYVIMAILTILAPLAFGVGGSKNTEDIFKGWVRMFASMCVMMIMNVVFLKIMLSAMSTVPTGLTIIPWIILIVAIGRVARKIDDMVSRIGMNTARTGDPMGKGNLPGMLTMMVVRNLAGTITKSAASNRRSSSSSGGKSTSGRRESKQNPVSVPNMRTGSSSSSTTNSNNFTQAGNHFNQNATNNASQSMSQSVAQNMSSQDSNSQTASSVTGNTTSNTAGTQSGRFGSVPQTRPQSNNVSTTTAGTGTPSRPPLGRNNPRQEIHKPFSGKGGENTQNTNNNSVMTTTGSAGIGVPSRPPLGMNSTGSVSRQETVTQGESKTGNIIPQSDKGAKIPPRQENIGAGTTPAGTASAGMVVPNRPPLGVNNTSSVSRQGTIAKSESKSTQEVSSTLGRKQSQTGGVAQTTSSAETRPVASRFSSEARAGSGSSASHGRNVADRNNPEIYTRHSDSDIPPLQSPSLNRENKQHSSSNYGTKEGTGSSGQRPPTDKNRNKRGKRGDRT